MYIKATIKNTVKNFAWFSLAADFTGLHHNIFTRYFPYFQVTCFCKYSS